MACVCVKHKKTRNVLRRHAEENRQKLVKFHHQCLHHQYQPHNNKKNMKSNRFCKGPSILTLEGTRCLHTVNPDLP